jgi:hypothetical protein
MSKLILFTTFIITGGLIALLGVSLEYSAIQEHAEEKKTAPDSIITFESYYDVLPDSLKQMLEDTSNYDDLKNCFNNDSRKLSKMPIFKPDSTLTQSMPILITPPVDQEMIIPRYKDCNED